MRLPLPDINSPVVFFVVTGLIVAYIVYMIVRKRKGERAGVQNREPEL